MLEHDSIDLTYFVAHPVICRLRVEALQGSIALGTMNGRGIRGWKQYGKYFAGMWAYGLINPDKARIIRSAYFWFRHVDDVADLDKPLPQGYENQQEFLQRRKDLLGQVCSEQGGSIYGDREDILLVDYFSLARRLRIDLRQESREVLDTIILDEERARNRRLLTQEELDGYFEKLDFACGEGALKVAGETCNSRELLSLSWAVRTMFNLRDFPKDFVRGIINISAEDIREYGIDLSRIEGRASVEQVMSYAPMRRWYKDQTATGINFLHDAKLKLKGLRLKGLTRFALNRFFVGPTERTLNKYAAMLVA